MVTGKTPYGIAWEREQTVKHYDKYLAYAKHIGDNFANSTMLNEVVEQIKLGDLYLNGIRLSRWDVLDGWYRLKARGLESGGWSLANTVCTSKVVALKAGLQFLMPNLTIETGEDMQRAIEIYQATK